MKQSKAAEQNKNNYLIEIRKPLNIQGFVPVAWLHEQWF